MSELKECPFCGGKAAPKGYAVTECLGCGASALNEDWNRRSMPECVRVVLDSYEFGNGGNATSDKVHEYYGEE